MSDARPSRARPDFARRRLALAALVAAVVVAVLGLGCSGNGTRTASKSTTTSTGVSAAARPVPSVPVAPVDDIYSEAALNTLQHAIQDPAAADVGSAIRFAGGLDVTDTSATRVVALSAASGAARAIGHLPVALHDAAGAALRGALYVFGGGTSSGQLSSIIRVDAAGSATVAGSLPAASSDSSAAVVGNTAYVVGGYDGTHWLDTILAYTPQSPVRVVAHLPTPVRYAAVGAVDGRVIIAGGSTPQSDATTSVYTFDPGTGVVALVGHLPVALTHAAAAGRNHEVLVVGGRTAAHVTLDGITAIDPATKRIRDAGRLRAPRSDAALVAAGARLVLIGGRNASGTLAAVSTLVAHAQRRADATTPVSTTATNVYAADGADQLAPAARAARSLVYVPNSLSNTVDVIDPATMTVIAHFAVGALPQHVTPAWDMRTLFVDNDKGNSLTPIDPVTGQAGPPIPVTDPYNLYFTLDGHAAIVVAERFNRLDFRDPHSMRLLSSLPVPCRGIDHMDFTADGTQALASCEFSGSLVVIDIAQRRVERAITLPRSSARPQDVKLSPDGRLFYVADMTSGGVWELDARTFAVDGFLATGSGAHGLYPSRDARDLYVTNRSAGTVSVVSFATRSIVATWSIPGGSPDMGGVSADGRVLWLSGRYNGEVYAISTTDGHLIARIRVGSGPHGVCVWPQPGRFSLGHTGITR